MACTRRGLLYIVIIIRSLGSSIASADSHRLPTPACALYFFCYDSKNCLFRKQIFFTVLFTNMHRFRVVLWLLLIKYECETYLNTDKDMNFNIISHGTNLY